MKKIKQKAWTPLPIFIAISFVSIFYLIQIWTSWIGLRISGVRGGSDYRDLQSVLNSAKCFEQIGLEVYKLDAAPVGCGGFQYSIELLRLLNISKISRLGSYPLGSIFMWATIIGLSMLLIALRSQNKKEICIATLAFISPGIWLLLERGNFDEIVFLGVITSALLMTTGKQSLGVLILGITCLIKFYTLPALFVSILLIKNRKLKIAYLGVSINLAIYLIYLIRQVESFPSTWNISFGLNSFGLYSQLLLSKITSIDIEVPYYISILLGILLLSLSFFLINVNKSVASADCRISSTASKANFIYLFALTVFLSCFFVGMNFDYRLIYLAVMISLLPRILPKSPFRTLVTMSGLGALFLSTFSYGLSGITLVGIQLVGDIALSIFVASQLFFLKGNVSSIKDLRM